MSTSEESFIGRRHLPLEPRAVHTTATPVTAAAAAAAPEPAAGGAVLRAFPCGFLGSSASPVRQVETATRRRGAGPLRHSPGAARPAGGASGARTRRPDVAARALGPAGMRALLSLVLTAGTYVRRARTRGRREADPPTRPVSRRPAAPPAAGGGLPAPCAPHPRIRRCVPSPHRPWDRQILNPARRGGGARHTLGWSPSCAALQEPLALSEPPVPDGDQGDRGRECSRSGE